MKRRVRRRPLNRGTAPLWWADPPAQLLEQLYQQARRSVRWPGGSPSGDPVLHRQPWLRKVSAVFHQLLREQRIYVEGA